VGWRTPKRAHEMWAGVGRRELPNMPMGVLLSPPPLVLFPPPPLLLAFWFCTSFTRCFSSCSGFPPPPPRHNLNHGLNGAGTASLPALACARCV